MKQETATQKVNHLTRSLIAFDLPLESSLFLLLSWLMQSVNCHYPTDYVLTRLSCSQLPPS
jgi:hypothetical protein